MIKNRIYYVHARQYDSNGEVAGNGGATIAWEVNEAGDLVIGQPAYCSKADRYVREIGRGLARVNLLGKAPLLIISAEDMAVETNAVIEQMSNMQKVFSVSVVSRLLKDFVTANDEAALLSTGYYEYIVRTVVQQRTKVVPGEYTI